MTTFGPTTQERRLNRVVWGMVRGWNQPYPSATSAVHLSAERLTLSQFAAIQALEARQRKTTPAWRSESRIMTLTFTDQRQVLPGRLVTADGLGAANHTLLVFATAEK